jgi:hypothetical protein
MKAFLTGIAFAVGMVLATQAFAFDDLGSRCPHSGWKSGHYVCDDVSDNR